MDVTFVAWAALVVGLVVLLLADLFVLHPGTHEISTRNALWSTVGFIAISVAFGIGLGIAEGGDVAAQFFTGYLLEFSLSLDNVFVWSLILSAYSVPAAYQHRVLYYGIFGALVLRGAFVARRSRVARALRMDRLRVRRAADLRRRAPAPRQG